MTKSYRPGAAGALLDEYERAINELREVLGTITAVQLTAIADAAATNPDCISIQTVLAHVVRSGYSYAVYILNHLGIEATRPERVLRDTAAGYQQDLDHVFAFTLETFKNVQEQDLEQPDNAKKIQTSWDQIYDIEQLMEHAIVHILRHRRQVERFIQIINRQ